MGTIKKFSIPIILINAVYFLAQWALPFDAKATKEKPFFASEGNTIQVSFYSEFRFFLLYFLGQNTDSLTLNNSSRGNFFSHILHLYIGTSTVKASTRQRATQISKLPTNWSP